MSDLVIEKERAFIRSVDGVFKLGTTKNAFGNVVEMLEGDFPGEYTAQFAATAVLNELNGKGSAKDIFGFHTSPAIMLTVSGIVDGRDQIAIDLKDVERLRIEQHISIAPQPNFKRCRAYLRGRSFCYRSRIRTAVFLRNQRLEALPVRSLPRMVCGENVP